MWRGSSRLTSCMSVFLDTGLWMCLQSMCHPVCSSRIGNTTNSKSATASEEDVWKDCKYQSLMDQHLKRHRYHSSTHIRIRIWRVTSLVCGQRQGSRWGGGRISRCFLLSCSPETFLVTLNPIFLLLRIKEEGQMLIYLLWFRCCLNWAGITKTWVSVSQKTPATNWKKIISFCAGKSSFFGFKGKSLVSTHYDATDHILVMYCLHFGGS